MPHLLNSSYFYDSNDTITDNPKLSTKEIVWYLTGNITRTDILRIEKIIFAEGNEFYFDIISSLATRLEKNNYDVSLTLQEVKDNGRKAAKILLLSESDIMMSNAVEPNKQTASVQGALELCKPYINYDRDIEASCRMTNIAFIEDERPIRVSKTIE